MPTTPPKTTLPLPFHAPTAPYVKGSATSAAAASAIEPDLNALQTKVLTHLRKLGAHGATDEEMQIALDMNPSTQRPRRIELVKRGLALDSGTTRPTKTGKKAVVWRAK